MVSADISGMDIGTKKKTFSSGGRVCGALFRADLSRRLRGVASRGRRRVRVRWRVRLSSLLFYVEVWTRATVEP